MEEDEKREKMLSALSKNIPKEILDKTEEKLNITPFKPTEEKVVKESEEDHEFVRQRIKKLIDTSDEAIATMLNLATDAEHPRAFEVLSNLLKTSSDINQQLITIHKDRKKLLDMEAKQKQGAGIIDNSSTAVFVGTTSELQSFLEKRDKKKQNIVDVDVN